MRSVRTVTIVLAAIAIATVGALSLRPIAAEEAAPKPQSYKPIPVTLPQPVKDPSFAPFLKQVADIAKRKDRAALAKHVAASFFWTTDEGKEIAVKGRPGIDNISRALYLDNPDTEGWEILAAFASDATADPHSQRKGVVCGPGEPKYDTNAASDLGDRTGTTSASWYYPARDGIEVRGGLTRESAVVGKLGMHLVWIYPDESPAGVVNAEVVRIVLPSGKFGYVAADAVVPLPGDLLCYVKEGNDWKIAGYIGGLPPAK
jgi:hypothetical protein